MTATLDRLRTILARDYKLEAESLAPDTPLDSLGVDSLGVAELLFNIEDEFGIVVPPEPVQLSTLGEVVRFVDDLVMLQRITAAQAGGPAQTKLRA